MLSINIEHFPLLATERLLMQQLRHEDAEDIYGLRSDQEVMKYIGRPLARSADEMAEYVAMVNTATSNNERITWGIFLKSNPKLIGIIGFHRIIHEHHRAEIGYLLSPRYHRQGIMHEAMAAVLDYGFSILRLHSVEANVDKQNVASIHLLEKNNFIREGHFKENYYFEGIFLDSVIYSLITPHR